MLAERMKNTQADCYLINTGWFVFCSSSSSTHLVLIASFPPSSRTGGKFGQGKRCPLKYTRAIVDAIHNGTLAKAEYENFPV
jgi:phosphoenolpyruvate carboxykinase (ATP)